MQDAFDIDSSGNVVAVERRGDDGVQLWLIDAARNVTARVDTGSDAVSSPVLSHDGARLTYIARQEGRATVIERTTRGGDRQTVFDYRGEGVLYLSDRSWDGLLTLVGIAERNRRIAQLVPRGWPRSGRGRRRALTLDTARVSPDGKWVAFSSTKSGPLEGMSLPFLPAAINGRSRRPAGTIRSGAATATSSFTSRQTAR